MYCTLQCSDLETKILELTCRARSPEGNGSIRQKTSELNNYSRSRSISNLEPKCRDGTTFLSVSALVSPFSRSKRERDGRTDGRTDGHTRKSEALLHNKPFGQQLTKLSYVVARIRKNQLLKQQGLDASIFRRIIS